MNREFFAIGMMEYGGIGLLIVAGLFIAALDLARRLAVQCASQSRSPSPIPFAEVTSSQTISDQSDQSVKQPY